jgi:hypothetical protein
MIDASEGIITGADGYVAHLQMVVDTTGASQAYTSYLYDEENSETRYSFFQFDAAGDLINVNSDTSDYEVTFILLEP